MQDKSNKLITGESVFVIAEISANHGQEFDRAVELIHKAKEAGADAVKFQTYTPDTITIDCDNKYFQIDHSEWGGQTLYELYQKAYTPWNWFEKLKEVADEIGIIFFSAAFDKTAVDLLEEIDIPIHKIASPEIIDLPLIECMAKTGKPLIISTGMATVAEIDDAVSIAKENGTTDLYLLRCVSAYPANPKEMNLRTIPHLRKLFNCPVGLSDHTLGIGASVAAVALGAEIIEKHFTISRDFKTPDSFFSLEFDEFKSMVDNIRFVEQSLGSIHYGLTEDEKQGHKGRRSLFVVKDIKKGDLITEDNVRSIRPAQGIKPKYIKSVLGKYAIDDIKKGTPLSFDLIT